MKIENWFWVYVFLVLAPVVVFLEYLFFRTLKTIRASFSEELFNLPSRSTSVLTSFSVMMMIGGIFVWLAGPYHLNAGKSARPIVAIFDVSASMLAKDVFNDLGERTSRAEKAAKEFSDFLDSSPRRRVALVTFGKSSLRSADFTPDLNALKFVVSNWIKPDHKSDFYRATSLSSGIKEAKKIIEEENAESPIVILFSDGGHSGVSEDLKKILESFLRPVYVFGVGDKFNASFIVVNKDGKPEILKDNEGNPHLTQLREEALVFIAHSTGGAYYEIGSFKRVAKGFDKFYADPLLPKEKIRFPEIPAFLITVAVLVFVFVNFKMIKKPPC